MSPKIANALQIKPVLSSSALAITLASTGCAESPNDDIPVLQMSLGDFVDSERVKIQAAGRDSFDSPFEQDLKPFREGFEKVLEGHLSEGAGVLNSIGYEVVRINDPNTGEEYVAVREKELNQYGEYKHGWGLAIIDPTPKSPGLNVQVPHPLHEEGTIEAGLETCLDDGCETLIIAGAHRDADNATITDEEGVEHQKSDVTHNPETIFHEMHKLIDSEGDTIIQYHGNGGGDDEPDVIVSGGRKDKSFPAQEEAATNLLEAELGLSVGICGLDWDERLCATTNVQGKYSAEVNPGGFVHVELRTWVREDALLLRSMAQAIFE